MNKWFIFAAVFSMLAVGSLLKISNAQSTSTSPTYEYKVHVMEMESVHNGKQRAETWEQKLNELGKEGWRLVNTEGVFFIWYGKNNRPLRFGI